METTLGFIKEAPALGVAGFNVYHKNRLIRVCFIITRLKFSLVIFLCSDNLTVSQYLFSLYEYKVFQTSKFKFYETYGFNLNVVELWW